MDTQEALQSSSTPPIDTDMPWGWLVPLTPPVLSSARPATVSPVLVPVKGETMKVGRDHDSSDLTVDDSLFTGSNDKYLQCSQVSRVHFELKRVGSSVALIDQSMNGTYVNGIKVGKGKQQSLDQGDVVAILQRDFDVFVFVSEARLRKMYPDTVVSKYVVGRVLGEGSSAVIREAFDRESHKHVALKIFEKKKWPSKYSEPDVLGREVDIVSRIDHPCITKILEVYDDNEDMFVIVMEYAAGGELFDQVKKESEENILTESTAKLRFYQISNATAYLHKENVCHRDLKLENILMMNSSPTSQIKIADFGLSKHFNSIDVLETLVGTVVYMAPEVISLSGRRLLDTKSYTVKSDCWSLGVMLYILLSGSQPFRDSSGVGIQGMIMSGNYSPMTGARWDAVSDDAKDLVEKLFRVDPTERLSAKAILQHKWFQGDRDAVRQAELVMGLGRNQADDGRESERGENLKRKREGNEDQKLGEARRRRRVFEYLSYLKFW